jgi:hypothetical protein
MALDLNNLANALTGALYGTSPKTIRSRSRALGSSDKATSNSSTNLASRLLTVTVSMGAQPRYNEPRGRKHSALPAGRMPKTDILTGSHSPLPRTRGEYRHINKVTGSVDYVGQTDNLRVRQQQHAREGRLDTRTQFVQYGIARPDATKDDLCQTERDHIARHKPPGNKTKGGNGRR